MRLALGQINTTVGDVAGNAELVRDGIRAARRQGADLVMFPELALTGYPPEDLLLKEHFLADAAEKLQELAAEATGIVALVGFPERGEDVYNALAVLHEGAVHAVYHKVYLPNYGVFDEQRYFQAGPCGAVLDLGEDRLGLTICEDIWEPGPPASDEALNGATLIVNISASPYHVGKGMQRERMFAQRARDNIACVAFCGLVGGQDELVFDGHSCVLDHTGTTIARGAQFREELLLCDVDLGAAAAARLRDASHRPAARRLRAEVIHLPPLPAPETAPKPQLRAALPEPLAPEEAEVYHALVLGLRDYVLKNGFDHVVLGISGGIDSALVACLAADALRPQAVSAAVMPSRYSSAETQQDAHALAGALGIAAVELPIEPMVDAYGQVMSGQLSQADSSLAQENLQARIRGNMLMALSNEFGWLVLTTGNKSEMSVGYTTLYGDLAGGFAVIKDVPKTLVYRLCRWRNSPDFFLDEELPDGASGAVGGPIPESIIERAPSAELRHDQRDEDSLPPYPVLDEILEGYVELDRSREQLIAQGLPAQDVDRAIALVDLAEYKRRQAPPGIKITPRAFGRDRRMPITNRYRG
jgi:NAD+ synthase (glutamine-hydrolysing)